jgi:CRP/FNR family transcriptional regulator
MNVAIQIGAESTTPVTEALRLLAMCEPGVPRSWVEEFLPDIGTEDESAVDELIAAEIIREDDDQVLHLEDQELGRILLEQASPLHRQAIHAAFAGTIAYAEVDAAAAARSRAFHLAAAERLADAVQQYLLAAERSLVLGDIDGALDDFGAAIATAPAEDRPSLMEQRATAAANLAHPDASRFWSEIAEQAHSVGDTNAEARALVNLFRTSGGGDVHLLQRAASLSDQNGWVKAASAVLASLGGDHATAIAAFRAALRDARDGAEDGLEEIVLQHLAVAHLVIGDVDRVPKLLEEAIRLARSRRSYHTAVGCSLTLVDTLVDQLELDHAMTICRELQRYVSLHGLTGWEGAVYACEANLLGLQGRLPAAGRVAVLAARSVSREGIDDRIAMNAAWVFAHTMLDLGRIDEDVVNAWRSLVKRAETVSDPAWDQLADYLRVRMLLLAGKPEALGEAVRLEPTETYVVSVVAPWLARMGLWTGETALVQKAKELAPRLASSGTSRKLDMCRDEVEAAARAAVEGDTGELEQIATTWAASGRALDAARVLAAAGAATRDERHARALYSDAYRTLASSGAAADMEQVARRIQSDGDALNFISETDLFRGLPDDLLVTAGVIPDVYDVPSGHVFFAANDSTTQVFFLRAGQVRLHREASDGKKLVIAMLDPGAVFGESSLLGEDDPGVTAEAAEQCTVAAINADDMRTLMTEHPQLGLNLLDYMNQRLSRSSELAEEIAFWNVGSRIARLIVELDERYGHPTLDGKRIINRVFSHSEIAGMVASRRPTVATTMNKMVKDGIIEMRGRRIAILDPASLQGLVDSEAA